jgi:hypothetical protein
MCTLFGLAVLLTANLIETSVIIKDEPRGQKQNIDFSANNGKSSKHRQQKESVELVNSFT